MGGGGGGGRGNHGTQGLICVNIHRWKRMTGSRLGLLPRRMQPCSLLIFEIVSGMKTDINMIVYTEN